MAPYLHLTLEGPRVNRILRGLGVEVVTEEVLDSRRAGAGADGRSLDVRGGADLEADTVVLVTQRNADDGLFRALKDDPAGCEQAGIHGLYQIGDCLLPGMIADAVFSGHRLAREIDSADPATPLPYIRERRLLHATEQDFELGAEALVAPPLLAVKAR